MNETERGCRVCPDDCRECIKNVDCECYTHGATLGQVRDLIADHIAQEGADEDGFWIDYVSEKIVKAVAR